jgi:signal recognition particle subunit SRP54
MFESLTASLSSALGSLRGRGKLTAANMREGLEQVRTALLEADVAYDVAGEFLDRVAADAEGAKVLESLDPAQQLVGIVHRELVNLMGPVDHSLHLEPGRTTVLMLCGLQGSGKTTSSAKLAKKILATGQGVIRQPTGPGARPPIRSPSAPPAWPGPAGRRSPRSSSTPPAGWRSTSR